MALGSGPPGPSEVLASLPARCLRSVLEDRCIPHDDCVDAQQLAKRIEQSPKGSVFGLPARVLKQMLREGGLTAESEVHVDKEELARRVMVVRSLTRARKEQEKLRQQERDEIDPECKSETGT